MGRVRQDLDIQHSREATKALSTDTCLVNPLVDLKAQRIEVVVRSLRDQLIHINRSHQGFLGQHHRFFRRAPNAYAKNTRLAPASSHARYRLHDPVR